MSENVIDIVETNNKVITVLPMPLHFKFVKFLFVGLVGFVTTEIAEKAFDAGFSRWSNHNGK